MLSKRELKGGSLVVLGAPNAFLKAPQKNRIFLMAAGVDVLVRKPLAYAGFPDAESVAPNPALLEVPKPPVTPDSKHPLVKPVPVGCVA